LQFQEAFLEFITQLDANPPEKADGKSRESDARGIVYKPF
jgi:hypothetical protein